MSTLVDLTGNRYGKLTVIKRVQRDSKNSAWLCLCNCGKYSVAYAPNLKSGKTRTCGCGVTEATIKRCFKHGDSRSKLYMVWAGMKDRCNNPNNKEYELYGQRGISVCEEWENDYLAFKAWAEANGYSEGLTIDRTDNDGNYEPKNCRWVTRVIQNNNRRTRRWAKKPTLGGA